ncbi:MAG TPA: hypothetical protein VKM54_17435 [Myxococcota bacterium]|nr:hypothetical protein [Myxococcota bacterium]
MPARPSGGAAFVKVKKKWWRAGVLYAVAGFEQQPPETPLYGNFTFIADLAKVSRADRDAGGQADGA